MSRIVASTEGNSEEISAALRELADAQEAERKRDTVRLQDRVKALEKALRSLVDAVGEGLYLCDCPDCRQSADNLNFDVLPDVQSCLGEQGGL